jgi:hypothetical protein
MKARFLEPDFWPEISSGLPGLTKWQGGGDAPIVTFDSNAGDPIEPIIVGSSDSATFSASGD